MYLPSPTDWVWLVSWQYSLALPCLALFDDPHLIVGTGNSLLSRAVRTWDLRCSFSFSSSSARQLPSSHAHLHSHSCESTVLYVLLKFVCRARGGRHDMLCSTALHCTALHFCVSAHGRQVHGILLHFLISSSSSTSPLLPSSVHNCSSMHITSHHIT